MLDEVKNGEKKRNSVRKTKNRIFSHPHRIYLGYYDTVRYHSRIRKKLIQAAHFVHLIDSHAFQVQRRMKQQREKKKRKRIRNE